MKANAATAWKWFSLYIRKKDALVEHPDLVKCYTCGKLIDWKYDCDAGHFQSRRYESTKFDEDNVHPQCKYCNHHLKGNIAVYYEQIEKTYGKGTASKIIQKSQQLCKRSHSDYKRISDEYRLKYNEL